jgi:2-polyprenyl-6-methoxyphenol hydroxylase-like FAD-dependent oxidoreductase
MDVAVVGGGIGGLSLALQLERAGIDCRVYESVPAYAPSAWASICFHSPSAAATRSW